MDRIDIAIVGNGPAGLAAALNAKVRNKRVLLIGPATMSEKLKKAEKIDNYLGMEDVTGQEMMERFQQQVDALGVERHEGHVESIYDMGEYFGLLMRKNILIEATSVIVATGVTPGKSIPGEEEFLGRGAGTCATCDAALYKGRPVVVVGFNEESVEEANFISELASTVVFVNRLGRDVMLAPSIREVRDVPVELVGADRAEKLILRKEEIEADGFFFIRDAKKPDQLVPGLVLNGAHIAVDRSMQTNLEGLYACGDAIGTPYQIQKAAGEGQVAGLNAASYVSKKAVL